MAMLVVVVSESEKESVRATAVVSKPSGRVAMKGDHASSYVLDRGQSDG